jgi:hypothetical protein
VSCPGTGGCGENRGRIVEAEPQRAHPRRRQPGGEDEAVVVVARLAQHGRVAGEHRLERGDPAVVRLHEQEDVGVLGLDEGDDLVVRLVLHQHVRREQAHVAAAVLAWRELDLRADERRVRPDPPELVGEAGRQRWHRQPRPGSEERQRRGRQGRDRDLQPREVPHPHPPGLAAGERQDRDDDDQHGQQQPGDPRDQRHGLSAPDG